jgi:hypothetical protein
LVIDSYHDRAFLQGWLTARQWVSCKDEPYAPLGKRVAGAGQFAFHLPPVGWLRIVPALGKSNVRETARRELESARTRPTRCIALVWDDDSVDERSASNNPAFRDWAGALGATPIPGTEHFLFEGGQIATQLCALVLSAPDAQIAHLPPQQTLERLACAAIADAYPARASHVHAWITGRPSPPDGEKAHKTHAASHMAGWFSSHGYEDFFRTLWSDATIRAALERRLDTIGATRVLELAVAPPPP